MDVNDKTARGSQITRARNHHATRHPKLLLMYSTVLRREPWRSSFIPSFREPHCGTPLAQVIHDAHPATPPSCLDKRHAHKYVAIMCKPCTGGYSTLARGDHSTYRHKVTKKDQSAPTYRSKLISLFPRNSTTANTNSAGQPTDDLERCGDFRRALNY